MVSRSGPSLGLITDRNTFDQVRVLKVPATAAEGEISVAGFPAVRAGRV